MRGREPDGHREAHRCGDCAHLSEQHSAATSCQAGWCGCVHTPHQVAQKWPEPETIPTWKPAMRIPSDVTAGLFLGLLLSLPLIAGVLA